MFGTQVKLEGLVQRLLQVQPEGQFRYSELRAVMLKAFTAHPDLEILTSDRMRSQSHSNFLAPAGIVLCISNCSLSSC